MRVRAAAPSKQIDLRSIPIHPKRDEWYYASSEYAEDQRMVELGVPKSQTTTKEQIRDEIIARPDLSIKEKAQLIGLLKDMSTRLPQPRLLAIDAKTGKMFSHPASVAKEMIITTSPIPFTPQTSIMDSEENSAPWWSRIDTFSVREHAESRWPVSPKPNR